MTKDEVWDEIKNIIALRNGKCKECMEFDQNCACLAGAIRHWIRQIKDGGLSGSMLLK
jgi:hypothetical protein